MNWVFHKEHKLVQDKVLMNKCWELHTDMKTEVNPVMMNHQGWLYQVESLRVLRLVTLRVKGLEGVI